VPHFKAILSSAAHPDVTSPRPSTSLGTTRRIRRRSTTSTTVDRRSDGCVELPAGRAAESFAYARPVSSAATGSCLAVGGARFSRSTCTASSTTAQARMLSAASSGESFA
jgi:hypothetical protein